MNLNEFRRQFKNVNGFYITKNWILFRKPLELWNEKTNKSIKAKKLEYLLDVTVNDKTIAKHIEDLDKIPLPSLNGGRGQSDSSNKYHRRGFPKGGDPFDKGRSKSDFPARANIRIKTKTLENAMQEFREFHKNKNKEWAYEVDSQGFVHQYVEGSRSSVGIQSRNKGTMILHNHPSHGEPNFSGADMWVVSADRRAKGIVASSEKYDYVFKKGTHFKANEFVKATKRADLKGKDYSDAIDKWLKKNQKKYGYTYYKTSNHLSKSK